MPEGVFNLGFTSGGGYIPDSSIWWGIDPATPNGSPNGTTTPGAGGGGGCAKGDWFCQLVNGLVPAASSAFRLFEQNDLANEALARNSSVQFDNRGNVVSAGGINIGQYLPLILLAIGALLVFKLVAGR